jgi:hypothetical protein
MPAGQHALRAAGQFLAVPPHPTISGCHARGCGDFAPVAWVSNFTKRPPITPEECNLPTTL